MFGRRMTGGTWEMNEMTCTLGMSKDGARRAEPDTWTHWVCMISLSCERSDIFGENSTQGWNNFKGGRGRTLVERNWSRKVRSPGLYRGM